MKVVESRISGLEIVLGELLIALRETDGKVATDLKARLQARLSNKQLDETEHNTILNQLVLL